MVHENRITQNPNRVLGENTMSIFINGNRQLTDKNLFGKKVVYKIPKSIQGKRDEKRFKEAHNSIKSLLINSDKEVPTSELKELVSTFYLATPHQQQSILQEGLSVARNPNEVSLLSDLVTLYGNYIIAHKTHKTKNLDLARLDTWRTYLIAFGNDGTLNCVNRNFISDFVNWRYDFRKPNCTRNGEVSDSIITKEVQEFKKCLEWNFSEGHSDSIPRILQVGLELPLRKNRQSITPLSIEEQVGLLDSLRYESEYFHDYFLLYILTGLRAGEADNISRANFNIKEGTLIVHSLSIDNSIQGGKTNSAPRILPLNKTLLEIYERGFIFQSEFTHKIGQNTYQKKIKGSRSDRIHSFISRKRMQGKLPKDIHLHRLRHTFVTNNLQAERPNLDISRWSGHKLISITLDRYGKYVNPGIPKLIKTYKDHLKWLEEEYFV